MAENQNPKQKPDEGTPSAAAGEEGQDQSKLFLGRYKTLEEAEEGFKELEMKLREQGTEKNEAKRKLEEYERQRVAVRQAQTEEERKQEQEKLDDLGKQFAERFKKGPGEMMRAFYDLIETHPSVAGALTPEYLRRQAERDKKGRALFAKVASHHKEDWKELEPIMSERWNKLPLHIRQNPDEEILETIYLAAKALKGKTSEEKEREEAEAEKAGLSQGIGGEPGKKDKRSETEKTVDRVVSQYKKDQVL